MKIKWIGVAIVIVICGVRLIYGQNLMNINNWERQNRNVWITSGTVNIGGGLPTDNFKAGQLIGNTSFYAVQLGDWFIRKATVVVENQITGFATEPTLTAVHSRLKDIAITSGTISVNNLPAIYNVTGSTVTMIQNTGRDYQFAIRNDPTQPDRYLRINTFNGLDIRLQNNLGTLISTTAPLPIADHSVWTSSFTATNNAETIKTGATDIARVIIGAGGVASSLIIRDGTTDTAPIVAVIDTITSSSFELGFRVATGLHITTTGTTPARLTIVYR